MRMGWASGRSLRRWPGAYEGGQEPKKVARILRWPGSWGKWGKSDDLHWSGPATYSVTPAELDRSEGPHDGPIGAL